MERLERLAGFLAGERDLPVTIELDGHRINARAIWGDNQLSIAGVPEKSNPREHEALFQRLDTIARAGATDWGFRMGLQFGPYEDRSEQVGWLRAAYLVAFAALGYRYAYRTALDPVREQIRNPEQAILERFALVYTKGRPGARALVLLRIPRDLRCLLVHMGRKIVFLPGLEDDAAACGLVLAAVGKREGTVRLDGVEVPWPKGPQFALDFTPGLATGLRKQCGYGG